MKEERVVNFPTGFDQWNLKLMLLHRLLAMAGRKRGLRVTISPTTTMHHKHQTVCPGPRSLPTPLDEARGRCL